MAKFNYQKAKEAGYSDSEIQEFQKKKAKSAGYSDEEINKFLSSHKQIKEEIQEDPLRLAMQPVKGALQTSRYGLATSAWEMAGIGESMAELEELEERLPELKKKFPQLNWPEKIDREKYLQATKTATGLIPTVSNVAGAIEGGTGLPLTPKTDWDKRLAFVGEVANFGTGTGKEKIFKGLKGAAMKDALETSGVSEGASDLLALYYALYEKTPKINVSELGKETPPPSGPKPPPEPPPPSGPKPDLSDFSDKDFAAIKEIKDKYDITASEAIEIYQGKRAAPSIKEPPPSAPNEPPATEAPPLEPQYAPEGQKITAPKEFLKSDFELAQDIQQTLSPLKQETVKTKEVVPPQTINRIFSPVSEELNAISPNRLNDPNFIGLETSRAVKRVSKEIYNENTRLWNIAEDLASEEIYTRRDLAENLRSIIEEAPSKAAGGEAKLQDFAESLLKKIEKRKGKRVHYMGMSNAQLINEIKQARAGYNYQYSGGVQGHRINEFINMVEQELMRTSSDEARNALLRARESHKNWAIRFKDPTVLPFRSKRLEKPQSLYNRIASPDTYNILSDILSQDRRGQYLLQLTARNMLEKTLEPYLLRPKSFNPMKFESDMQSLKGIVPDDLINSLEQKVYRLHEAEINKPISEIAKKEPTFQNISEKEISSKLSTIEGLRQLKKELEQVPGGKETYREVSGTMGIDLLFGGQMDVPANSDRIRKMINDRNGRPYIKETLGEDNLHVLDELVKNNNLEKRLLEIKESPTLSSMVRDPDIIIKTGKLLWNILKGNPMKIINQTYQLQKKLAKHMKPAETAPAPPSNINLQ